MFKFHPPSLLEITGLDTDKRRLEPQILSVPQTSAGHAELWMPAVTLCYCKGQSLSQLEKAMDKN